MPDCRDRGMCHASTMQPALSVLADLDGAEPAELKLVIVYDDFANGRYAMDFLERLIQNFGRLFTFVPRFLRLEELREPCLDASLTEEAGRADMVVIAAREEAELPGRVETLMRAWEGEARGDEGALIALLRPIWKGSANQAGVRSHLEQVARRAGRTFLCKQIEWPEEPTEFAVTITQRTPAVPDNGLQTPSCAR
jgi:hypothetical protein